MAIKKLPWWVLQDRETPSEKKIREAAKELQVVTTAPLRDRVRAATPVSSPSPLAVPQPSTQPIPGTLTPLEAQTRQLEETRDRPGLLEKTPQGRLLQRASEPVERGLELAIRPFQAAGALTGPLITPGLRAAGIPEPLAERFGTRQEGQAVLDLGQQLLSGEITPRDFAGQLIAIQESKPILQQLLSELPAALIPPVGAVQKGIKVIATVEKLAVDAVKKGRLVAGQQVAKVSGEAGLKVAGRPGVAGAAAKEAPNAPRPTGLLGQASDEHRVQEVLVAAFNDDLAGIAEELSVNTVTQRMADNITRQSLRAARQSLDARGLPDEFIVWRGGDVHDGAMSVSLSRETAQFFAERQGGGSRPLHQYRIKKADVLADIETFDKTGLLESELLVQGAVLKRSSVGVGNVQTTTQAQALDRGLRSQEVRVPAGLQTPQRLRGQAGVSRPLPADIGEPPVQGPRGTTPSGESDDIIEWFGDLIASPESVEAWERTLRWRSQVLAGRAGTLESRAAELIRGDVPVEEAITQATRESLAGELPRVTTTMKDVVSPEVRAALFSKLYRDLSNEPLEMASTAEALRNALLGKPIPRKPGTAGGSAFTRLTRVFPESIVNALDGKNLDDLIALQMAKKPDPRGPSRPVPLSERGATQLVSRDLLPSQGGVRLAPLSSDPRTATERALDIQRSRLEFADKPQPGGAAVGSLGAPTPRQQGRLGEVAVDPTDLEFRRPEDVFGGFEPGEPLAPGTLAPDPRTAFQRELDNQLFKLDTEGSPLSFSDDFLTKVDPVNRVVIQKVLFSTEGRSLMRSLARETGKNLVDVFNFIKSNMASGDVSWPRQMSMLIFSHPVKFTTAFARSIRAMRSEAYYKALDVARRNDPDWIWYERVNGDFIRPIDDLHAKQWGELADVAEDYMIFGGDRPLNKLARSLPHLRLSGRAHVTGINEMAFAIFKDDIKAIHRINERMAAGITKTPAKGYSIEANIAEAARKLAAFSGRGPLGPLRQAAPILNALMFSSRLFIGRLISPRFLFSSSQYVRRQAWKDFITGITGISSMMLLGEQAGIWELEKDPRSADFMKGRIGPIRFDPWGGWQQYAVLYSRLLSVVANVDDVLSGALTTKSTTTGEINAADPVMLASQFLSNKKSPGIGNVLELWTAKDFIGRDIDRTDWKRWLARNSPLAAMDIYEAFNAEGLVGSVAGATALVGGGVQVYDLPRWPELDVYYRLETSRERELYRRRNPDAEAKLFIRGQITTLLTKESKLLVPILMRAHDVSPVDVKGYEKVFGSLRLPNQRELQPVQKGQLGGTPPREQEVAPAQPSEPIPLRDRVRAAPTPVGVR